MTRDAFLEQSEALWLWLQDRGFVRWQTETVFPEAINRWIQEACK